MEQRKRQMVRILAALLVLCALLTEQLPNIGDKNIVRGAVVSCENEQYRVSLFYQRAEPQANAADAQQQLYLVDGEGQSLARAYAAAEAGLTGQVVYTLCDLMLLAGPVPGTLPEQLLDFVADSECGRLSARIALLDVLPDAWLEPQAPVQDIYAALTDAADHAPALYETAGSCLLFPVLAAQEDAAIPEGAILTDFAQVHHRLTNEEAAFFTILREGSGQMEVDLDQYRLTLHALSGREKGRFAPAGHCLSVLVNGLPADTARQQKLLSTLGSRLYTHYTRFCAWDAELEQQWSGIAQMKDLCGSTFSNTEDLSLQLCLLPISPQ